MANVGIVNIAVIAVLSSGCATGRVQVESAYCEVRPYSPVAVNKTLGWAELLELYLQTQRQTSWRCRSVRPTGLRGRYLQIQNWMLRMHSLIACLSNSSAACRRSATRMQT